MKKILFLLAILGVVLTSCETDYGLDTDNGDTPIEQPENGSDDNNDDEQNNPEDNQGETPIFVTDSDGNIVVDAEGGEVVVTITTNLDYEIVISEDAQSWLSVADTRTVRIDKLTFIILENQSKSERSATILLLGSNNEELQRVVLRQKGAEEEVNSTPLDDIACASNEILYTTKYDYTIDLSIREGFGGKYKSNSYRDGVGRISFDNDVTQIPNSAFAGFETLTNIKFPDSVVRIGEEALLNCVNLGGVILGDGLQTVGYNAFSGCVSLAEITIPDSVTKIGSLAFYECTNLKRVNVSSLSRWCKITFEDNPLRNGADLYVNGEKATDITIPSDIVVIGAKQFYKCNSITSVNIHDDVVRIGEQAFYSCKSLSEVTIGSGVQKIEEMAFMFSLSLSKVYCKPANPPTGELDMFATYSTTYEPLGCMIYVPTASVSAYKSALWWSFYESYIKPYDF